MKRKIRFTLGKKIVVMILAMSVILSATALFVSYRTYQGRVMSFYKEIGSSVVRTLASQLDPDKLDYYYETLEMDDAYYETQKFIADLVESSGNVEYLYVVHPHGVGITFLFDSDMEMGENGDYTSGGYCALGTYVELLGGFAENLDRLLAGQEVEPIVQQDPSYGWLMTAMVPVLHDDGTMAGYVMADISMNEVMQEQRNFLLYTGGLLAALTLVFVVVYLILIRRNFIRPIQQLTDAAQGYEGGESRKAFSAVKIKSHDELRTLSDAFRMMLVEIDLNNMEQKELAVREQRLDSELELANELSLSMLPKELPRREGGYPFAIRGRLHQGREFSCCFYDYFLLGPDRLCLMVGEVPGGELSRALYTVMAQATIKSQLRTGQSLKEAMTSANRQLYEMSDRMSFPVLVGVLDGTTGTFSCISAGQRPPLLMRGQDRYEWMKDLSYAPLGESENVVYQELQLELRQGDRMFFHTDGLDDIQGGEGRPFGQEQLRLTLNEPGSRQAELEEQLRYVTDAAGAYADRVGQISGYAVLALEYRRRDRAQAHCVLSAGAEGGGELMEFLRGQMEANHITGRRQARLMVVADELFALCRAQSEPDSRFLAECAVPPGEGLVILRLKGSMGGRHPLDHTEGEAAEDAAEFIRRTCEEGLFEHGSDMETGTVVKRIAGKQEAEEGECSG